MTFGTGQRGKKSLYGAPPFIVTVFKDHIESWTRAGSMIYAKPKRAAFQHLLLEPRFFGLTETKWYVTAVYEVVAEKNMDAQGGSLYRRLKHMECELGWKGLLFRQCAFKPNEFLEELRGYIPDIKVSDELSRTLNENEAVMGLLKSVKPSEMAVTLNSIPAEYQPFLNSREVMIQGMIDFYTKPRNVAWNVRVCKVFNRGPRVERKAGDTIRLLNEVIKVLTEKAFR